MNPNKLSIRFVISKAKMNKRDMCPLSCRLTYKGVRKAFATLFINPENWNVKKQIVISKELESKSLNGQLAIIHQKLSNNVLSTHLSGDECQVEDIYDKFFNSKD